MIRTLTAFSIAACVGMTSFAMAQETATETMPDTMSDTMSDTMQEPAVPLDMGQPVGQDDDGLKIGDRYVTATYDDWEMVCFKTEAESDPCSLVQVLVDATGNPTAEVSLFRLSSSGQAVAGFTVVVPLETSLPAKLTIAVDGAPGKQYIYSFCNTIGCVAQIGLTQADVDSFKRGVKAAVSLVPAQAPDQVVSLKMSLKGFTKGYDNVNVVEQ